MVSALEMATKRTGGQLKETLNDIIAQVRSGTDLATAVESHGDYFPELFNDMLQVGEQTGSLPEVLKALSEHYEQNVRLRKDFLAQVIPSIIKLIFAILIVAGLITILGWIAATTGAALDVLGWGLVGTSGALKWLSFWAMATVLVYIGYRLTNQSLAAAKAVHRTLMAIPVVGRCLQDFAIARFSWAFHLTQQAGMSIDPSIESSFKATSNGAFISATEDVIREVNDGSSLTAALDSTGLFPDEFIQTVDVAETSGTVPEALNRLSPQFQENAHRSMQALSAAMGWAIWSAVAVFIIFIVFRIILWYVDLLNGFTEMASGV